MTLDQYPIAAHPGGTGPNRSDEGVGPTASDSGWIPQGELHCLALEELLAPWLTGCVQHIGSTAIPGLCARPVLDLQAPVSDLLCATRWAIAALGPHGWHCVDPDLDRRPWRRVFIKARGSRRRAHLQLMSAGAPRWAEHLAFRDTVRADPALAATYAALKRELIVLRPVDHGAYTGAKSDFIRLVLDSTP